MPTNQFQTFVDKWAKVGAQVEPYNIPASALQPIIKADQATLLRGNQPMTEANALLAVMQTAPQSPLSQQEIFQQKPKDPGWNPISMLGAGARDLQTIASGLNPVHLVPELLHEVEGAPKIPGDIAQALGEHSAGAAIRDLAQTPLLRMIPGVHTAAEMTTAQGRLDLREHPLMSLLDVLPYADLTAEALFSASAKDAIAGAVPQGVKDAWHESWDKAGLGPRTRALSEASAQDSRALAQDFRANPRMKVLNEDWKTLTPEERLSVTQAVQGWARDPQAVQQLEPRLQLAAETAIWANQYVEGLAVSDRRAIVAETPYGKELYVARGKGPQAEIARYQFKIAKQQDKIDLAASEGKDTAALRRKMEQMQADQAERTRLVAPERFRPAIRAEVADLLKGMAAGNKDAIEALDRMDITGGRKAMGMSEAEYETIFSEISRTWGELKQRGLDPIGEWRVEVNQLNALYRPTVDLLKQPSIRHTINSALDFRSHVSDVSVQLSNVVFERMRLQASTAAQEWLKAQPFVRTEAQLTEELTKGVPKDPRIMSEGLTQQAIKKEGWVRKTIGGEDVYVPSYVSKTLDALGPHIGGVGGPGAGLGRLYGRGMHVFRTSVLLFSPRYYIHQILGTMVMVLGETGPGAIKFASDAWQLAKDGTLPPEIARGIADLAPEDKIMGTLGGRQMGNMYADAVKARFGVEGHPVAKLEEVARQFHNTVADFGRALTYLYGKEKWGVEEGVRMANKVLANWDRMTPVERTVIRNVFPFYGWMSHVMRYVLSYPIDHPLRASIVSKFAVNEEKDWKSGLPQSFQQLFYLGAPDANGNVKSINVRSLNPFRDVANYLTLTGLVSSLNPIATSVLESLGIRLPQGTPDLYPQLTVDPLTGQLTAQHQNVLPLLVSNFIPQADVLMSYFGWSNQLRALKLSNPQALQQHLLNAVGIPWLPREYSIPQEETKFLIAREKAASSDLSHALKTGDWSAAQRWSLVPYQGKLVDPQALERLVRLLQLGATEHGLTPPDPKTLLDEFPRGVVPQLLASGQQSAAP